MQKGETFQFLCLFVFSTFQITMKASKLALLLLLVLALEILLFAGSDAYRRRRRRRRRCSKYRPPNTKWVNRWRQSFNVRCRTSKKSCYQFCYLTYIQFMFLLRLFSPVSTTRTSNEQLLNYLTFK